MTAKELRRILKAKGCVEVRQNGSHLMSGAATARPSSRSMRARISAPVSSGRSNASLSLVSERDG
jgi:hypothetical protein